MAWLDLLDSRLLMYVVQDVDRDPDVRCVSVARKFHEGVTMIDANFCVKIMSKSSSQAEAIAD